MDNLCAHDDCQNPGKPQGCYADGQYHHHGRVHYDHERDGYRERWRDIGWLQLCDKHYAELKPA